MRRHRRHLNLQFQQFHCRQRRPRRHHLSRLRQNLRLELLKLRRRRQHKLQIFFIIGLA